MRSPRVLGLIIPAPDTRGVCRRAGADLPLSRRLPRVVRHASISDRRPRRLPVASSGGPSSVRRRTFVKSRSPRTPAADRGVFFPLLPLSRRSYEGLVSDVGQVDKLGCFVFADGDRYDGHFRRGAMHGYGVYYWKNDRSTYFGGWNDNAQTGCGVKFYGNGAIEYGEWKDDQYLGSYTGVCGEAASYAAMNNAIDVAQRARMFKYKPDSEVALQKRPYTLNQDPVVYEEGTQWQMPGWRGELATDAPTGEELREQHPRLYAQMQRHNEIWERAWRYYNLDAVDAQEFGEKKRTQEAMEEEARALAASMAPENQDDYDEYGDYDVEEKPKKKKGKSKKGRGTGVASISLSARNAGAVVEAAFERAGKWAMRRPTIAAFAERRAMARARREAEAERGAGRVSPFASLSLAVPFARR